MTNRQKLIDAWEECKQLYRKGCVNSERTLQAAFYSILVKTLPETNYVLCEPTINIDEYGTVIPDLVVTDDKEIVAVVEFKFVPHYYPVHEDDLEKLKRYGNTTGEFQLLLDARSGKFSEEWFTFSQECCLVFAVIGQHDAEAVEVTFLTRQMGPLAGRFLPLVFEVKDET